MKARKLLIYLSLKYDGDWRSIYHAIETREKVDPKAVEDASNYAEEQFKLLAETNCSIVTVVDDEYPQWLKDNMPSPFVAYLKDGELATKPFKGLRRDDPKEAA